VLQVNLWAVHDLWAESHPDETGSKLSTFIDLSMELASAYCDFREPERQALTEEEQFWALTGESAATLRPGKLVTVKVVWVQDECAGLKTDSGARACAALVPCAAPCGWDRCDAALCTNLLLTLRSVAAGSSCYFSRHRPSNAECIVLTTARRAQASCASSTGST
jgi:hypothetical protein